MCRKGELSDLDTFLRRLRAGLPVTWVVTTLHMDSKVVGQMRPRIYIVGHAPVKSRCCVERHLPQFDTTDMSALIMDMPNDDPAKVLSARQQQHLKEYCRLAQSKPIDAGCTEVRPRYAVFEVDRDPCKKRAKLLIGRWLACLRAGGQKYWVIGLGGSKVSRLLTVEEYCAFQGMRRKDLPASLSRNKIKKGVGNAMTVPVVGAVLNAALLVIRPLLAGRRPAGSSTGTRGRKRTLLCGGQAPARKRANRLTSTSSTDSEESSTDSTDSENSTGASSETE